MIANAPSRTSRLSHWLGAGAPSAGRAAAAPRADRNAAGTRTIEDIQAFLLKHRLSVTADSLAVAHDHLLGSDRELSSAIALHMGAGTLDDAAITAIAAQRRSAGEAPDVTEAAATLSAQLRDCLAMLGESCSSARDYQQALDSESRQLASQPAATLARLLDLTAQAVATSRRMAERLEETQRETEQLRNNLNRARRAAERDHLTGLVNRRGFDQRLRTREAQATGDPWCVALCDIDDFKAVNDRHGHDTGDRVLKFVARQLQTVLGTNAIIARHGGEEFACLFENSGIDQAQELLERLRAGLDARSLVNQQNGAPIGSVTISIGLAAAGVDGAAAMRAADAALYAAKRMGKNRVLTAQDADAAG